jgi:RNA polymerase sigma-70 factor (ECF subfamily)
MEGLDASDIQATLQGDDEAYARLVRRHQDAVARRLWRFTRRQNDLEELVQETFVQAFFSLRTWRGRAPFAHWLMRIATRVGCRYWKKSCPNPGSVSLTAQEWNGIAARDDADQAAQHLHELLDLLPWRDRLVLLLLYVEGHSMAEAAHLSGWSRTMVKVQAFRARRKLRKLLNVGSVEEPGSGGSAAEHL